MKYTLEEKIASKRFSSIKARVDYILDDYWSRDDFIKWFVSQKQCYYCKSSIEDLHKFYEMDNSTRKLTRGKTLEVDRLEPKKRYTKENCIASCYWCNNAKSDVFFKDEFQEIGKIIGKVIQKRLNQS